MASWSSTPNAPPVVTHGPDGAGLFVGCCGGCAMWALMGGVILILVLVLS